MKVIVKEFKTFEKRFVIVKQDDAYCAIDYKYIDEEGKLKQGLNGLQMHCAKTLEDCMYNASFYAEFEHLVNVEHMDKKEAFVAMIQRQKEGVN